MLVNARGGESFACGFGRFGTPVCLTPDNPFQLARFSIQLDQRSGRGPTYFLRSPVPRTVWATYEERLATGDVEIRDLVVSKRITREPREYQKAGVTAIAAQQLFGSGVKLRPGQNIEYILTDCESVVPNDRVRAFALWEGWFGYDRKKYAAMLREAFQPFELFIVETPSWRRFS
jgi:hypothetical protein